MPATSNRCRHTRRRRWCQTPSPAAETPARPPGPDRSPSTNAAPPPMGSDAAAALNEAVLMARLRGVAGSDFPLAVRLASAGNRRFPDSPDAPERASILIHALAAQGLSSEARGRGRVCREPLPRLTMGARNRRLHRRAHTGTLILTDAGTDPRRSNRCSEIFSSAAGALRRNGVVLKRIWWLLRWPRPAATKHRAQVRLGLAGRRGRYPPNPPWSAPSQGTAVVPTTPLQGAK